MTDIPASQSYGKAALCYGAVAMAVYLLMINITLAQIELISGLTPFDMRPSGYHPDAAARLLDGLKDSGRWYYLTRQIPLDTIYPALLALTLINTLRWLGQSQSHRTLIGIGVAFSLSAAIFDYAENIGIALMLWQWPGSFVGLVQMSSLATMIKSGSTVAALCVLISLTVLKVRHYKMHRSPRPSS